MASERLEITLGDLGRIVTGKTPLTLVTDNFGGDIPFVTPSDMDGRKMISSTLRYLTEKGATSVKGSRIPAGSVMVSCIGSDMGKAAIAGRECVTNQQINSIVVEDEFCGGYVYYDLSTRKAELQHIASGAAQPILNKGHFSEVGISLPPLPEQKAIAAVLGALDDKIELNRRMNATLEAMARVLFQSWFVDFDPVRAKAEGRPPAGLDEPTAALFPAEFQKSELGQIPQGWRIVSLEELASIRGGKQLPTIDCLASAEFPVFGANGIMGYANQPTHDGFVIAFGRVGAYCGAIHWSLDGAWINNNASSVVPIMWPEYVLQSMLGIDFHSMRTGSAQPFIANSALSAAKLLRPSDAVARRFCSSVAPLRRKQAENERQSHTLASLRDALLPRLLSGELRCEVAGRLENPL
jgi:type I restriction enzyme S subunit